MRNRNTVEYLGLWERIHNPDFNYLAFEVIENEAGRNSFVLTPKRWIESVNAIGMTSKAGRYASTFAHKDIAFKFAAWISVELELYVIKDYQRLKADEKGRSGGLACLPPVETGGYENAVPGGTKVPPLQGGRRICTVAFYKEVTASR